MSLRSSFDEAAELYDRVRPRYPAALIDDLATHVPDRARIVEIGCGTGQATTPLAERGYRITCVELGERLASVARRNLGRFDTVEIVRADFETWQPREAGYDGVVAFTAFHWLDPAVRYARAAALLHDRGVLAVVATRHVLPTGGDRFFAEVQEDYDAVVPDEPSTKAGQPGHPDAIDDPAGEIDASGLFRTVASYRHVWDVDYTADEYLALLDTYSGHRARDEATRERLNERIRRRIEARPGQTVRKTYLALLNVAGRRIGPDAD
jgi:SAM-dependent methyltransferase